MPGQARAPSTSGSGSRMSRSCGLASERVYYKSGKRILTRHSTRSAPRSSEPLRANGATEEEIDFLETHRVELNAFTSGDLVDWIEAKLDRACVEKVVPDDATLAERPGRSLADVVVERILDEKAKEIDAEVAAFAIDGSSLATRIRDRFAVDPTLSWNGRWWASCEAMSGAADSSHEPAHPSSASTSAACSEQLRGRAGRGGREGQRVPAPAEVDLGRRAAAAIG